MVRPTSLSIQSSAVTRFRDVTQMHLGASSSQMVWRHYAKQAIELARRREALRRDIMTLDAWRKQAEELGRDFASALGPPLPKHQPEIVLRGTIAKRDLIIHKLLFSSSPDNWITGCLYLPKQVDGPLPAVVLACGHSAGGKADDLQFGPLLARNGYAAISFDLPGQGERKLWEPTGVCDYPTSTQHNMIGARMILGGASLGWFMVQEVMAAVSVLQERAEVDPGRIAITGGSGGGWLSVHAAAMDPRIAVIAPAAAVRSFRHEVQADDAEQTLFDMQRQGLDFPDLMGFLLCPRPTLILANSKDIWNIRGTQYAYDEARRFYEMHDRGDRINMMTWDRGHAYEPDQFVEAVRWFDRWLKPDGDGPPRTSAEEENIPTPAELQVMPQGNLYAHGHPSPISTFARLARTSLTGKKNVAGFVRMLKTELVVDAAIPWAEMDSFKLSTLCGRTICCAMETDLFLPINVFTPPQPKGIMILLDECGRDHDRDWQLWRANEGWLTIRPDLRGWGETSIDEDWADWEGWARRLYDGKQRQTHAIALMVGRSLPFERARDLLGIVNIAREISPDLPIAVHGRRQGAFVALLAALVDPRIDRLILEGLIDSFQKQLEPILPDIGCESFIQGWLQWGIDVSDLLATIGTGRLVTDFRTTA